MNLTRKEQARFRAITQQLARMRAKGFDSSTHPDFDVLEPELAALGEKMIAEVPPLDVLLDAVEREALVVKVGRSWWLANVQHVTLFDGGDWIVHVDAGPHRRRSIITNMRGNAEGREFAILSQQGAAQ